jgi:hypothetical protein
MASASLPYRALVVLPVLLAGGCAGGNPTSEGLGYGVPDPNPVAYTFTETTRFTVWPPGTEPTQATTEREGVAELDVSRDGEAYRVEVRFPRFEGSFSTTTQGAVHSDGDDIGGPITVALDPTGRVEVTDTPSLSPDLREVTDPGAMVRPLFVRLPGRTVQAGATWTDTIETVESTGGTETRGRSIVVSTLAGDTAVEGTRLLVIVTRAANEVEVTGVSGGVAVEQSLRGETRGRILWDARRALLVERAEEGDMEGELAMPDTGVDPLPVTVRLQRTVRLRP